MDGRITLGISACLLGEPVRYDGGHKKDPYLVNTLGKWVDYVGVCPEAESGMGIPREPMRLEGDPKAPRLITHKTRRDLTGQVQTWGETMLEELEALDLCGYVFKSRSPTSGMARIKVYGGGNRVYPNGTGIWARMFMDRFPLVPAEDEGRLHDPALRENFITRVFVLKRYRDMIEQGKTVGNLVDFHTRHKLLILSRDEAVYREMGRFVAGAKSMDPEEAFSQYLTLLTRALSRKTTVKKNINVLMHALGHFKKDLTADEKQEFLEIIDQYKDRSVPLIVPVTLLNHHVRRHKNDYLAGQVYLHPHPAELGLRNHV